MTLWLVPLPPILPLPPCLSPHPLLFPLTACHECKVLCHASFVRVSGNTPLLMHVSGLRGVIGVVLLFGYFLFLKVFDLRRDSPLHARSVITNGDFNFSFVRTGPLRQTRRIVRTKVQVL